MGSQSMSDDKALDHTDDPTWIFDVPDDHHIAPPVETREQELPFGKLSWQNFERLCHGGGTPRGYRGVLRSAPEMA
jgi:hypothetical protein